MKESNKGLLEKIYADEYHRHLRSIKRGAMRMDISTPVYKLGDALRIIVGDRRVRAIENRVRRAVDAEEMMRANQLCFEDLQV